MAWRPYGRQPWRNLRARRGLGKLRLRTQTQRASEYFLADENKATDKHRYCTTVNTSPTRKRVSISRDGQTRTNPRISRDVVHSIRADLCRSVALQKDGEFIVVTAVLKPLMDANEHKYLRAEVPKSLSCRSCLSLIHISEPTRPY